MFFGQKNRSLKFIEQTAKFINFITLSQHRQKNGRPSVFRPEDVKPDFSHYLSIRTNRQNNNNFFPNSNQLTRLSVTFLSLPNPIKLCRNKLTCFTLVTINCLPYYLPLKLIAYLHEWSKHAQKDQAGPYIFCHHKTHQLILFNDTKRCITLSTTLLLSSQIEICF